MNQIGFIFLFFFSVHEIKNNAKAQGEAWINGFKAKVDLEHPAGLIYPLAHPGYWGGGETGSQQITAVFVCFT